MKSKTTKNQSTKKLLKRTQAPQRALALVPARPAKAPADSYLGVYKAALTDPFSLRAQGARVPDMYSVPTATRHITRKLTLVTNAQGEADLLVIPSAYLHAMSPRGSIAGGSTWTTGDAGTVATALSLTTASTLAAQLVSYRIVGYGVKLIGTASMTSNSGSLVVATLPVEGYLNTRDSIGGQAGNIVNSGATVANTLTAYGVPNASSVVSISSLPSLPNSMEASLVNVSEHPLLVTPRICSPSAFNFKLSSDIGPGYNAQNQTSAASISVGNASFLSFGGHESVIIGLTGGAASTAILDVEVTYHLEGSPLVAGTAAAVIGGDSAMVSVDPISWMNVIRDVARLPTFKSIIEGTGNSFFPGLGSMVTRLL